MRSPLALLDRWRAWRPFGVAKRVLSGLLGLAVVSSLLAVGPAEGPERAENRSDDGNLVAAAHRAPGSDASIEAAPEPAPPALGSGIVPVAAEDPEEIEAEVAATERERQENAAAAERRALWFRLADCESGVRQGGTPVAGSARWDYGLSPGENAPYEGGLQFAPSTWDQFRDASMPDHAGHASPDQQITVAERVLAAQGWGAWPVCSRMLGLRG